MGQEDKPTLLDYQPKHQAANLWDNLAEGPEACQVAHENTVPRTDAQIVDRRVVAFVDRVRTVHQDTLVGGQNEDRRWDRACEA